MPYQFLANVTSTSFPVLYPMLVGIIWDMNLLTYVKLDSPLNNPTFAF